MEIALDVLEPLSGIACGALQAQNFQSSLIFVAAERVRHRRFAVQIVSERNGAFQSKLLNRPDGEMRVRSRISKQDDILMAPAFAHHAIEVEPLGAAQV